MSDDEVHAIDCDMDENCTCGALEPRVLTAQDVIATVIDTLALKGIPLAPRYKGQLAKESKALLEAGFEYETVVVAALICVRRGVPHLLQHVASDLTAARAGDRMTRAEYERALQDEIEVGRFRR